MIIELHPKYIKAFKQRIAHKPTLVSQVGERVKLFQKNPLNLILHTHKLTGSKKGLCSFSINGDIRIIYILTSPNYATFLDIGTHNQVY